MSVRGHESISFTQGGGRVGEAEMDWIAPHTRVGQRPHSRLLSWARPWLECSPSALLTARQALLGVAARAATTGFRPGGGLIL